MKLILRYLRRHMGIFLCSMLFLTLEAVSDLLQPTFMAYIVDEGVGRTSMETIAHYGLVMLLIAGAGAGAAVMRNILSVRTSQTIGKELRRDMYGKVQRLSLENIDRLQPASIVTRITNDVTQVQEFVNGIMRIMAKAPNTCVGAIVLIILETPRQAPVMAVILVIASVLIYANMRVGYPRFGRVQAQLDRLNRVTREFLSSIRVVKAFRAEEEETGKFEKASSGLAVAGTQALRAMAVFSPLINLTVNFGIVMLLWISRDQNVAEIGRLMASVNYMTQVLFAVGMIANVINTAVRAAASAERIREVLEEEPAQKMQGTETPVLQGGIAFEDVSFAYAGSPREALKEISFRAAPGETIGIIGPTGSGKSTLVHLVPRLYDATQGRILLDGTDGCSSKSRVFTG